MEIAYNGRWGMVCDDRFTSTDARSVCEGLGFNRDDASMMSLTSARYMRMIIHRDSGVTLIMCVCNNYCYLAQSWRVRAT